MAPSSYYSRGQTFIFKSEADHAVVGFTSHRDGSNLPAEYAPWKLMAEEVMQPGGHIVGVKGGTTAVLAGLNHEGYFLSRAKVQVKFTSPDGRDI